MLRIAVTAFLCTYLTNALSQEFNTVSIGDPFPAIPPAPAVNHVDSLLDFSAYSDKLLILDFWATWCTACIGTFPKMDSLQKVFSNDVKIVLVNITDPKEKIDAFLNKYRERRGVALALPTVMGTIEYLTLLPHRLIPHYAWVYKGRLVATTGADEITAENMTDVLRNKQVSFPMKKDVFDYNLNKPLLENGNGGDSASFQFKTVFAGELPGMNGSYFERTSPLHRRKGYVNMSMPRLFSKITGIPSYGILLMLKNAREHTGDNAPVFTYEVSSPIDFPDSLATAFSMQDLTRYLNVRATISVRRIPVYRLTMSRTRRAASFDTSDASFAYNDDNTVLRFNRKQMRFLISFLNTAGTEYPPRLAFVDETGYAGTVTLSLPVEARNNIPLLRQVLAKEGIRIRKTKRKMKVCVIKDGDASIRKI
jgi:thiol-disulfide isomerase/thioredoxin